MSKVQHALELLSGYNDVPIYWWRFKEVWALSLAHEEMEAIFTEYSKMYPGNLRWRDFVSFKTSQEKMQLYDDQAVPELVANAARYLDEQHPAWHQCIDLKQLNETIWTYSVLGQSNLMLIVVDAFRKSPAEFERCGFGFMLDGKIVHGSQDAEQVFRRRRNLTGFWCSEVNKRSA